VLISVMLVNNETGAIQPVADIGSVAQEKGILMHTDAVQGMGLVDVNVDRLKVDLLSLSAHKIYGPKGIGALYLRRAVALKPLAFGGPQEQSLRPGTENVPGIVGLGAAIRLTCQHKAEERKRLADLRAKLIDGLVERVPGVLINGPAHQVAPHVVSASFPGTDSEMMLIRLNAEGIAVSLGSACNSKSIEPSHVLTAMGLPREQIDGSLRISMGYPTTEDEINRFLEAIPGIVQRVLAVKTLNTLFSAIIAGDRAEVQEKVKAALEEKQEPTIVLNEGMIAAMREVGKRFEAGDFFVPEMLLSARAMQAGMAVLKPSLQQSNVQSTGKVVIGTVKGDLHDIGKNLVALMLEGAGFEIKDMGIDVAAEDFIAALQAESADILALSALLTTTLPSVKQTIKAIEEAGLRDKVKIIIGGAPVTEDYARQVGADGYSPDASRAVGVAEALMRK
jgi:corrinoid protein of di/trimethylamine methyltransferase